MEESCPSTSKNEADSEIASEIEPEPISKAQRPINNSPGALKLRSWLNKSLRITMSDGRVLIGLFLCTDRDANVILGSCSEYLPEELSLGEAEDPRMLGLVMVPGKHIVNISVDEHADDKCWHEENRPVSEISGAEEVK